MPELAFEKARQVHPEIHAQRAGSREDRALPFAELQCKSNFSFLEGASHPDELVERAAELGYRAMAITDRNTLAGVVRAHVAAKQASLKLLIGAEITPVDAPPVVLLCMNRNGYSQLCRLITRGRTRAEKGSCELRFRDLTEFSADLIACVPLLARPTESTVNCSVDDLIRYRELYGDRCYGLAHRHLTDRDDYLLAEQLQTAKAAGVLPAASNDVYYHVPGRRVLQDVLTATRHRCAVADLGLRMFPNAERYLKSPQQMQSHFGSHPELIRRTAAIADCCQFSLDELRYEYPEELCPPGLTVSQYLNELTWQGAAERYPDGIPDNVRQLVEHELELISELHYEAYFLTVYDLVRFARSRDILCQGRGSAANSAVCYCLGVTSVDPARIDVLFERFISKERDEAPDIDIDFEHERREEVLQYIYEKYGRERAGMTATLITYRLKSAMRDVGKALGLSLDSIDRLAKNFERYNEVNKVGRRMEEAGLSPDSGLGQLIHRLVIDILGFPRHLSQHTGGMVMTNSPLCEIVPIENASMPGRTVVEWDKDDLDALGILKVDCLALGMLTAVRKCFDLLERHYQRPLTLATVPAEDPATYEMMQRADTIGVFQIESRAQMSMLPRLKPKEFYDLVIEVSLVRPGPIQGDMVHPYLRRRDGLEAVEYPSEEVRQVLHRTLGVPIFQEQAMKLAVVAAGFTPGEADQLRRAMGAWRKSGVMDAFHQKLSQGMQARGYSEEFAERLFNQIRGFGEYGFPESHAASFALLVYVSSWLKCHYPDVFLAAMLNSQPLGFYQPATLVRDAREHGVEIRRVDVNSSDWDCTLEQKPSARHRSVRLGFRMVSGLKQSEAEKIVAARGDRPYLSIDDVANRAGVSNSVLSRLARADAFGSLKLSRREALWESLPERFTQTLLESQSNDALPKALPGMAPLAEVVHDYRHTGLTLKRHPVSFIRSRLKQMKALPAAALETYPADRKVKVAGLILLRQRPGTAKGITFMTLEDETGITNLVVHPNTWERFRVTARTATAMMVRGILQRESSVVHVVVDRMWDLSEEFSRIGKSRDFS
ncbi:error-prone DNA polymerase [Rubinisphaera margarita]|uniref:error-prone DNA polymerase n=1 Tax=Rubinisphaera margarita TaxID=2909586 RepID=UPI001EE82689|nr:error-prone DNA polymerase [Rubinisphaera margarita]MCG6156515.1 error-prone DNA polymerase [Rubinisphaera margarita]